MHHTEERLTEDATRHLAGALLAVHEDDTHLLDLKADLMGGVFHLDLESVTLETDLVEFDGLKHTTLVAHETSCGVMYFETRDDSNVLGGKVTHQYTTYRPVHNIYTTHIARADRHVVTLVMTGGIEPGQIVRIVTEVGIHLEDVVVVALQCPLEPGDISRSQTEFATPFDDKKTVAELSSHQSTNYRSCSVGRAIVNDKDMETLVQGEYRTDYFLDILLLIVGWNDNYTVALVHGFYALPMQRYE